MAFTINGLTTQLLEKLNDGNLPLDKKVELSKIVFTSPSIPILQKEDCILDFLTVVLKSDNIKSDDRIQYFECLKDCLSSVRMKDFRGSLRPGVVEGVLQVVRNFRGNEEFKVASECIINLLSTSYFQRWLRCDVSGLCKLLGSFFNKVTTTSSLECIKVLSLCLNIHQITLLRDEFREHFINETYIPLAYAYSVVKDDEYNSFRSKAVSTIVKILLSDKSFINDFLSIMQLHKSDDLNQDEAKDIKAFCSKMKKLPNNYSVDVVSASFTLFLHAVSQKDVKQENSEQVFKVFMALCKVVGIRVDRVVSISICPVKKWTHMESFEVIGNMIDVLSESNIPLSIDFEEYTSQTWMVSLVIGMTNINLSNLTPQLLNMVKKAFNFNNLIIEPCLRVISNIILRNKTDLVKPHYIDLMKTIFEGAAKAQRFQKIITLFLSQIRDVLIAFSQTLDIEEDIFPKEVAKAFADTILTLAHSQILIIMKSILFHLEHDCLNFIQSGCMDSTVVTNNEIICIMMNQLFKVVKIADHSTPDVVKAKFNNLLDDLKIQLQKFGEIFTYTHHDNLIKAYLNMCHSYGAMKLMIEEYEGCPLKKLSSNDLNPTNLCFVHPYLDPSAWNIIVTKIVEHEGCSATHELYKLLIQKIEAVSQIEEGCEGPGTQASRLVLEIAKNSWLWDELIGLSGLFEAKELVRLIRRLIHENGNDQSKWKTIICNELFKEDRRLVLATAIRLLYKASKMLKQSDGTVSFDVLAYVPDETLLEYELALIITDDVEIEDEIVNSISAMVSTLQQALLTEQPKVHPSNIPHISFFEVLEQLPLHFMSVLSQSCIFHSILALLHDLPPNRDVDNILLDILLRLIVVSKKCQTKFFAGLDVGVLFIFIVNRSKEYPLRRELLQKICYLSLMEKPTAKQLLSHVCEPSKEDMWLTTMVIQSLMQKQKKQVNDDENSKSKPLNREKCISKLVSLCIPILEKEEPHPDLLNEYTIVLKWILSLEDSEQLPPLMTKLNKYIEMAMANYNLGVHLISTLITHRNDVGNLLPSNIVTETWNYFLFISEEQPDENLIHLLLTKSSLDEYEKQMALLSQGIEMLIRENCEEKLLNKTIMIINHIVTCGLEKSEKSRQRENIILQLVKPFLEIMALWPSKDLGVEAILEFFTNLAPSTYIVLRPAILDLNLLALSSVPLPSEDKNLLLKNLILAIKALFALYLFRTSLMLDRIPILLQRYRQYLEVLAPCGLPANGANIILEATECADKLESFAKTMAKRQRDFTRLAPYMVADLINIFERHQLHVDVKLVYTNIANVFLNLCDSHGISYLKAVSSPALFNTIYDNYKKYYRYVGKI